MKNEVRSEGAPAPIGPYSQGVKAGGFVFLSGQIGFDPATGLLAEGGVKEQTERTFLNLAAVLQAAGSRLDLAVKVTVYLADMNDFQAMNEVYGRHLSPVYPARTTVQAARLPKDAKVEIDVIALEG